MSYSLLRQLFFALDGETAHRVALNSLDALARMGLGGVFAQRVRHCSRRVMGIDFPNPVGLAAGLDKNAEFLDALGGLGFGFIEVGTVTPRPQPGNPRPRIFRIAKAGALINRMGFNNDGVDRLAENVERAKYKGVLGINIGKNFDTPLERAAEDYVTCLRRVYRLASYVTVNISSPNTQGLRELQESAQLDGLLAAISAERQRLADTHGRRVPLALKIAPDLDEAQIGAIAALLQRHAVDAVIATNTTVARSGIENLPHAGEAGGLSGAPLAERATAIVHRLSQALGGALPIIGVGGIMSGNDALQKIAAGASLVQLYTGLVYRGPALIGECLDALCRKGA